MDNKLIAFEGNVLRISDIAIWMAMFLSLLLPFLWVFYYYVYDGLFQLVDFLGPFLILMLALVVGTLAVGVLTQKLYSYIVGGTVKLSYDDNCLYIAGGRTKRRIELKNVQSIAIGKSTDKTGVKSVNRITIAFGKTIFINVGGFLSGINSKELDALLLEFEQHILSKKVGFSLQHSRQNNLPTIYYNPKVYTPPQPVSKLKIVRITLFMIVAIIASIVGIVHFISADDDSDNLVSRFGERYSTSDYLHYENQVYFLKVGDGYFKLEDADFATFSPLFKEGQYGTHVAADKTNVYWGVEKIKGIERQNTQYVGGDFVKDSERVFYQNHVVENADTPSFDVVRVEYGKVLYGYDCLHTFYKEYQLEDANPKALQVFETTPDYIKDDKNAYYENKKLKGVEASTFNAERVDYKLTYATDGKLHFVNGIAFPNKVENKIIGKTDVDISSLKLLLRKGNSSAHMVFYDKHNIYYFDESKQAFFRADGFDRGLNFNKLGAGVFADEGSIYYTSRHTQRTSNRRGGGARPVSLNTYIYKVKDVSPLAFAKIDSIRNANIWSDGKQKYISIYQHDFLTDISLWIMKKEISEVYKAGRSDVATIGNAEQIVRVKTRMEY